MLCIISNRDILEGQSTLLEYLNIQFIANTLNVLILRVLNILFSKNIL